MLQNKISAQVIWTGAPSVSNKLFGLMSSSSITSDSPVDSSVIVHNFQMIENVFIFFFISAAAVTTAIEAL